MTAVLAVVAADAAVLAVVGWSLGLWPRVAAAVRMVGRFLAAVLRHPDIPRWVRWLLAAVLIIPGPVDECAASVLLAALAIRHRRVIAECWRRAAE